MNRTSPESDPVDAVYGTLSFDVSTDEAIRALRGEPILDPSDEPERPPESPTADGGEHDADAEGDVTDR